MGKRGYGQGTIRQLSANSWQVRVPVQTLRGPVRVTEYATTKAEAEKIRLKLLLSRAQGDLNASHGAGILKALLDQWLDQRLGQVKSSTWESYRQHCRDHIVPSIGAVKLADLDTRDVERLLSDCRAKGISPATVNRIRATLRACLNWGFKTKRLARAIPLPDALTVPKYKPDPLSAEEVRKLVATARERTRLWPLYVVAVNTGARLGELLALEWRDVNLRAGELTVRRTLRKDKTFGSPKSGETRIVSLNETAVCALRSQRQQWETNKAAATHKGDWPDFVFHRAADGNHYTGEAVLAMFQRMLTKAGIRERRFHDLRHTFAVLALSNGADLSLVSKQLGHSSVAVTADIYGQVPASALKGATGPLDGLWDGEAAELGKIQR